jgi:hypothetical protein
MIQVHCPHCSRTLDFNEESAGLAVNCTSCGKALNVPAPLAAPPWAAADPLAGLGTENPLWMREAKSRRKRQRLGWSIFVRGVSIVVGAWLGASAAPGLAAGASGVLPVLLGSADASIIGIFVGWAFSGLFWFPFGVSYLLTRTGTKHDWNFILLLMAAGLIIGASLGAVIGACMGAGVLQLGQAIPAANVGKAGCLLALSAFGAVLGALPGVFMFRRNSKSGQKDGDG